MNPAGTSWATRPKPGDHCHASLLLWLALLCLIPAATSCHAQAGAAQELQGEIRALRAKGCESPHARQQLEQLGKRLDTATPYPVRREFILCQLTQKGEALNFDQRLATMQSLRDLASAAGDVDTANLMDIRRIFLTHADDDIDKYLGQLNEVRARIRADAPAEVMEALESSYGNMYFDAGNLETALRHQLAALDWAGKLEIGSIPARLYRLGTIADLYIAMGLPQSALGQIESAFAQAPDVPLDNHIALLLVRANALIRLNRLAEVDQTMAEVDQLGKLEGAPTVTEQTEMMGARRLLAEGKLDQAMPIIEQIGARAAERSDSYYTTKAMMLRGETLSRLGRVDEGLGLMRQATEVFERKGQMVDVLDGLDRQIDGARGQKDYARALDLMGKRQDLWLQLFRDERGRAIAELEAQRSAQQLEQRVELLAKENHLQSQSLRAERLSKMLALVLALFGVGLSIWMVNLFRRARQERDALSDAVRFDALTGAYSRYQFQRSRASNMPVPDSAPLFVLLIDLDHFKSINDQFGHDAGDTVLKTVVERLHGALGGNDELYRWGGEEFLLILHGRDGGTLEHDLRRLLKIVEVEPVVWHGQPIPVSISGGLVQQPLASDWNGPLVDSIRWADAGLYLAKSNGRKRIEHVSLTEVGRGALRGKRPIDLPQLLDWQRHEFVQVQTIQLEAVDQGQGFG